MVPGGMLAVPTSNTGTMCPGAHMGRGDAGTLLILLPVASVLGVHRVRGLRGGSPAGVLPGGTTLRIRAPSLRSRPMRHGRR